MNRSPRRSKHQYNAADGKRNKEFLTHFNTLGDLFFGHAAFLFHICSCLVHDLVDHFREKEFKSDKSINGHDHNNSRGCFKTVRKYITECYIAVFLFGKTSIGNDNTTDQVQ
jgi:hypothetical protein